MHIYWHNECCQILEETLISPLLKVYFLITTTGFNKIMIQSIPVTLLNSNDNEINCRKLPPREPGFESSRERLG